jgi:prepilin-type N-terminal cleavage/methylation domain-containing protein
VAHQRENEEGAMNAWPRLKSTGAGQRGFTMTEVLISTSIMLVVTAAIFSLTNPAQGTAQAQPEVSDMQQRMRIGSEVLFRDIVMAGAGPYQGNNTGSLINFFAPIVPRRTGRLNPDPTQGAASFKTDAITLLYIPNTYSQTTLFDPMPNESAELKVNKPKNCPGSDPMCGFTVGMGIVIFDTSGNYDAFTVTEIQGPAGHIQHRGQQFSVSYPAGSHVTEIVSFTYYFDQAANQLRRYDGQDTDVPLVDNVVALRFDYFGDSQPPRLPKPPPGTANCLYDAAGNYANLPVLPMTDGSLTALTPAMLTDGPYCGGGTNQFDADLLRIRKIRVTMRMQVATPSLRGGTDREGSLRIVTSAERYVPDYTVSFDVAPRNLNLSR